MIKEHKMNTCTPNVYSIRKSATSAVTAACMRTSTCEYQKCMGTKRKMTRLRELGITYQAYTTIINKNYERITEADTHKIHKMYARKTEIKEQGIFLLGELNSPFM